MPSPCLSEMIIPLAKLVKEAGDFVKKFRKENTLGISLKTDNSPITIADKASHDILVRGMRALYPNIPIVSEEDIPQNPLTDSLFFLIDPIDGTRDYIKGTNDYCINIALINKNRPILGIIYLPEQEKLFFAMQYMGSFQVNHHDLGKQVRLHVAPYQAGKMIMTTSINSQNQILPAHYRPIMTDYPTIYLGSAQKFTLIAAGHADFYPRMGQTGEWDTAAGDILIHEAGGYLRDIHHLPLIYGKQDFLNNAFFAYSHADFFMNPHTTRMNC